PGISSITAAAAKLNLPLTEWDEPLHVLPAVHKTDAAMDLPGTYVLMKSASHMKDVKETLQMSGKDVQAVIDCGMPTEQVYRSLEEIPDDAGYFALVIAKEPK
ncbi:MAG: precorrin-2 C(20)-methyltransferase, partial [Lachnospiraceae bacterium]|nr:precorrin-2 C(20)-methyltransferase [Lachnospiraceae bacterium]